MSAAVVDGAGLVLTLNAGSSSIKFSLHEDAGAQGPKPKLHGQIEGLLGRRARFTAKDASGAVLAGPEWGDGERVDHGQALMQLQQWLDARMEPGALQAVGHRVVHGGLRHAAPVRVDDALLQELNTLCPLAPLHQPHNLAPIRMIRERMPALPQVACFDTAFHRGQSEVVQQFALPMSVTAQGVRRYGFHGLSYEYIASRLPDVHPSLAQGRVIVAHLGNGASLCAMQAGRSVATTMGFSALDGLVMGTRCGALDAGVVFHLLRALKLSPDEAEHMLYQDSGLLGISGVSNDMRELRARADEPQVRLALDIHVHRTAREIGSLAAALGGVDALVFTAGIGEHSTETRAEVLAACAWLGFRLDAQANSNVGATGADRITLGDPEGTPSAWVIPTDEEGMLARHTLAVLKT